MTDLVRPGANTLGVALGYGTALVTRSVTNSATGRTAPYSWWQSQFKGSGALTAPAAAGDTTVRVDSVTGYHVGIRQAPGSAGYRDLVIDPRIVGDMTHVEAGYETPYGEVRSAWTRMRGVLRLEVEVPSGTTAEVWVPSNGRMAHVTPDGAAFDRVAGDRAVYRVPSGTYVFTVRDEPGHPRP